MCHHQQSIWSQWFENHWTICKGWLIFKHFKKMYINYVETIEVIRILILYHKKKSCKTYVNYIIKIIMLKFSMTS